MVSEELKIEATICVYNYAMKRKSKSRGRTERKKRMPTRSKSEITRKSLVRAFEKGGNEESEELLKASHQVDQTFSVGCPLAEIMRGLTEDPQTGKKSLNQMTKRKGRDGDKEKEGWKRKRQGEKLSEILSPSEKRRKGWLEVGTGGTNKKFCKFEWWF